MPKRQLTIQEKESSAFIEVVLSGAVDASNLDDLRERLTPLCERPGSMVLLNCKDLVYLNSAGFGFIFQCHTSCKKHSGQLVLSGVMDKINNLIKILGLDKILIIQKTREEAVACFDA